MDISGDKDISLCGMLGTSKSNAVVLQDVDGFIPLEFQHSSVCIKLSFVPLFTVLP